MVEGALSDREWWLRVNWVTESDGWGCIEWPRVMVEGALSDRVFYRACPSLWPPRSIPQVALRGKSLCCWLISKLLVCFFVCVYRRVGLFGGNDVKSTAGKIYIYCILCIMHTYTIYVRPLCMLASVFLLFVAINTSRFTDWVSFFWVQCSTKSMFCNLKQKKVGFKFCSHHFDKKRKKKHFCKERFPPTIAISEVWQPLLCAAGLAPISSDPKWAVDFVGTREGRNGHITCERICLQYKLHCKGWC